MEKTPTAYEGGSIITRFKYMLEFVDGTQSCVFMEDFQKISSDSKDRHMMVEET